jgi:aminoglycoside/choline kinase family phosphotransferase
MVKKSSEKFEPIPDFKALRRAALEVFASAYQWEDAQWQPLVDQASQRVYFRLRKNDRTIILLDSPNPTASQERLDNVVSYGTALNTIGLRAPKVEAVDLGNGFALLEDFGDDVFSSLFDKGVDKFHPLQSALKCLIHLHQNLEPRKMLNLGDDNAYFTWENPFFTDWYWPARYGHETPPDLVAEYLALWQKAFQNLPPLQKTMCMTDYHAPNLMWLKDGHDDLSQVGIIDYQDSLLASPVYDVMSLIEDDRRLLEPQHVTTLKNIYRDAMRTTLDPVIFDAHYAFFSAQRHAKNMGNFVRIAIQKNNPNWLEYVPTATYWFHQANGSHEILVPLKKWFDRYCPDYLDPLPPVRFFKE